MKLFTVLFSMLLLSACCTTIRSSDPDARIFVNGEYVGTGQANYSDRKVSFSNNVVTLRKEGCELGNYEFRRNEDPDGGAIVGGILFLVPFPWVTEYKESHAYEFDCTATES